MKGDVLLKGGARLDERAFLLGAFDAAVAAVRPETVLPPHIPDLPAGSHIMVLAMGKAAAVMAAVAEKTLEKKLGRPLMSREFSGLAVVPKGNGLAGGPRLTRVIEGGYPVPDKNSAVAAHRLLQLAATARENDIVLCLMSGGASSLTTLMAGNLDVGHGEALNKILHGKPIGIGEMNALRKGFSAISGGRLRRVIRARKVITLAISDVAAAGDDLSVIGSGPTVASSTAMKDARAVVERYKLDLPAKMSLYLEETKDEMLKAGDPILARDEAKVVAGSKDALAAAASYARGRRITPVVMEQPVTGEVQDAAREIAERIHAEKAMRPGQDFALIWGGETTVNLKGAVKPGRRGGRNTRLLGALLNLTREENDVSIICAGTDGVDFVDYAGAVLTPDVRDRAKKVDAESYLAGYDSHGLFDILGGAIRTEPTHTNVGDFGMALVRGRKAPGP